MTDTEFVRVRTRKIQKTVSTVDVLLDDKKFVERFGVSIRFAPSHYVHLFASERVLDEGEPILFNSEDSETSYDHAVLPKTYHMDK